MVVETEHLAYRYRLMPTPAQEQMFLRISGCCRLVFNKALEAHNAVFAAGGKAPSKFDAIKSITEMKKEHPFLKEALSQPLQQAVVDLYDGWDRFFKGQNDKPTWRSFHDAPSFRLPQPDQWLIRNLPGTKKTTRHLFLPKMGMSGSLGPVAFVQHRPIEGKVKHLTIARDGGMWYVSFSVERKVRPEVHAQRARIARLIEVGAFGAQKRSPDDVAFGPQALVVTGVDRNTPQNGSCVTNWGDVYGAQVRTPEGEQKLARLQRTVARKEEAFRKAHGAAPGGSLKDLRMAGVQEPKALREARADLAAFHGYRARCRKDIQHKMSRSITDMSDIVGFEALETKEMTAAPGTVLGDGSVKVPTVSKRTRKDILDAGWTATGSMVAYKCERAGKMVVRVNPAYTSQGCSACGHVEEKNRQGKVFCCVACGHTADADVNAGWNVRTRTIAALVAEAKTKVSAKAKTKEHVVQTDTKTTATITASAVEMVKRDSTAGSVGVAPGGVRTGPP
jgi:putative transposase